MPALDCTGVDSSISLEIGSVLAQRMDGSAPSSLDGGKGRNGEFSSSGASQVRPGSIPVGGRSSQATSGGQFHGPNVGGRITSGPEGIKSRIPLVGGKATVVNIPQWGSCKIFEKHSTELEHIPLEVEEGEITVSCLLEESEEMLVYWKHSLLWCRNRDMNSISRIQSQPQAESWLLPFISGLFLTFNSAVALYRNWNNLSSLNFIVTAYGSFMSLMWCINALEKVPKEDSQKKWRYRVAIWVLASILNLTFSFRISVVMPLIMSVSVWTLSVLSIIGTFYVFFVIADEAVTPK
ncbi:hypothetical protein QJS04_geneDACA020569 [Acorus gramineus]|uniref:Uncharacterized protein n=1 Tax=Acorus gramineus TaxID=55184 RepID=A0AAV8ZYP7_ACOGR|nr:hypothetical protein QJS04_geneDACA020569 [Acorus gramineus]